MQEAWWKSATVLRPASPRVPAPRPPLQPFCFCLCGPVRGCGRDRRAVLPEASAAPDQVCRGPGSRDPATPSGADAEKATELLWLPRSGVRPGSPRPGPGHSPMSPSSSSSSSSSMFNRTFLLIICMSPQYRHSAPLGDARLHSARAASSAQPSRHSLLHSARALLL